jgi:hypothetical protein
VSPDQHHDEVRDEAMDALAETRTKVDRFRRVRAAAERLHDAAHSGGWVALHGDGQRRLLVPEQLVDDLLTAIQADEEPGSSPDAGRTAVR